MANPFLGERSMHTPTSITDPVGDDYYFPQTAWHVAAWVLGALAIVVAMQLSGFRAMVGIGRS